MSDALPELQPDATFQQTVQVGPLKLHPSALEKQGGTLHVGPLSIDYALTTNPVALSGRLTIVGITAGTFQLSEQNPEFDVDLQVHGIGADGKLALDVANQNLNAQLTVSYIIGKKQFSGIIYHW
jgi:hypothetical protein